MLADAEQSAADGDFEGQREVLRRGLEASPEDVPLLMAAARYYLRIEPEGRYKPQLALHYAMRAARGSGYPGEELSRLLSQAYRAAGGLEEERALLLAGLNAVGHPDANAPMLRQPVDHDLLEPTLANLREQKRREEGAKPRSRCLAGMAYVPAGRYPPGTEAALENVLIEVDAFCIDQLQPGGVASRFKNSAELGEKCAAVGKRLCRRAEMQVACGAMAGVFGVHPACAMNRVLRCCSGLLGADH